MRVREQQTFGLLEADRAFDYGEQDRRRLPWIYVAGHRTLHPVGQLGNCGDVYIYLPWCLDAEGYDGGHS